MSNRLYDDAMALFERALDEPHDRRRDFVERECRGNRQLAEHVLALLAADESPDPLLEATPAELGKTVANFVK